MQSRQPVFAILAILGVLLAVPPHSAHAQAGKAGEKSPPAPIASPFPAVGILPKQETGVLRLLEQHPEFDGRGVVVAVFDTGVDPGAAGLQTTSDGRPKIVDLIDGTGSGDVDTSNTVEVEGDTVAGLSGRTLKLDRRWLAAGGKVRLGIKFGYDLFPDELVARLKRERREAFDKAQQKSEQALRRQIVAWDADHPSPNAKDRRFRAELDDRLEQLAAAGKSIEDPGPVYDCLVFRDGDLWRAVVDTDEDGDLTDEQPLTDFRAERHFATFGGGAELNFAVNIYDDGDCLSLVADCGAHATHVAGIIAGNYPGQEERNGIAPGAQIVSVKIGESRMGSMETGTAIIRGLAAAVERGCDLVNMSYGEPSTLPNHGRILDLIAETVDKHGVMFVAAAGNNGPGLSTIIAPGGASEAVMGVGAYVSPAMMQAEYTLREELPEMPFSWSSRGPVADGATGVDVFAPGAAIAPVPRWTLSRSMQMNGTSMASPNACGAAALLISGMKAQKLPCTPYSIRRALQNTARPIDGADALTQGAGLIQVDRALDYLLAHAGDEDGAPLRYDVSISGAEGRRGVLLREPSEVAAPEKFSVRVKPVFHEEAENARKIDFERRIALVCDQPWVHVGSHLLLPQTGRSFEIEVDPVGLETGVHVCEVRGCDADRPELGPLFRVPVTVIVPLAEPQAGFSVYQERFSFKPGQIVRRFFAVPHDATWVDLWMRSGADDRQFMLHTDQPHLGETSHQSEARQFVTLGRGRRVVRSFGVTGGRTLELCLAQYWSSLGETDVEMELVYRSLEPDRQRVTLLPGEPATSVEISSGIETARIAPQAKLDTLRRVLRPDSAKIRPLLSPRDRLPDGRQPYELLLEYRFEQREAGSATARFPANDGLLYDSPLGEQLWMLFDSGKRLIAVDDAMPDAVRLGKGGHVLRLQLRHDKLETLEALEDAVLWLERPLRSPISLSFYPTRPDALAGRHRIGERTLDAGERLTLHLAAPDAGRLPADCESGDVLVGMIRYGENDPADFGAGERPGGFELRYVVAGMSGERRAEGGGPESGERRAESGEPEGGAKTRKGLRKEIYELRIEQLERLGEGEQKLFDKLAAALLRKHPGDLRVLVARLERLDDADHRKERLPEVVAAADAVLEQIDTEALARHYGTRLNPEDRKQAAERRRMDRRRAILVDALYRKGRALGYMELPDVVKQHPIEDPEALDKAFEANFAELARWVDTSDEQYFLLLDRRERRRQHYGKALELLNRYIPAAAPKFFYFKKRRDIYGQLGWDHLQSWEAAWLLRRFPKQYQPF